MNYTKKVFLDGVLEKIDKFKFEPNDKVSWRKIYIELDSLLSDGIIKDYNVICTNNTSFDIYIQPTKSVKTIQFNCIAEGNKLVDLPKELFEMDF